MEENIDVDIKIAEEFIKKDYEPWSFYEKQGDELFELQESIKNILKSLKSYREDYNHRCQLAIDRAEEVEKLNSELEIYKKIAEKLAEYISRRCHYVDAYSNSCDVIEDSCFEDKDCKQCIIDWARKEVEKDGK